jgi:hypothetical protein
MHFFERALNSQNSAESRDFGIKRPYTLISASVGRTQVKSMFKFHSNLLLAGLALASFAALAGTAQEPGDQEPGKKKESAALKAIAASDAIYVGAKKCKSCHKKESRGNVYGKWTEMKHAKALDALKSEEAIAIGKERGIEKPWESADCLKCHETAFGQPKERKHPKFKNDLGVQCESCHGPGSKHIKARLAAAKAEKVPDGVIREIGEDELVLPDELLCRGCHNEESPSYKEFDFAERLDEIRHLHPNREKPRVVAPKKCEEGCEDECCSGAEKKEEVKES